MRQVDESAPSQELGEEDVHALRQFLASLGHLDIRERGGDSLEQLQIGLANFQRFYGLKRRDGVLDYETKEAVGWPRCKVQDVGIAFVAGRMIVLQDCPWGRDPVVLRYAFHKSAPQHLRSPVESAMRKWEVASKSKISFAATDLMNADFTIGWTPVIIPGEHNLCGNFIAHAVFPCEAMAKVVHFDNSELWAADMAVSSYNTQAVALHELGHTLGLMHSDDPDDVMYNRFGVNSTVKLLSNNDKVRLRDLYKIP